MCRGVRKGDGLWVGMLEMQCNEMLDRSRDASALCHVASCCSARASLDVLVRLRSSSAPSFVPLRTISSTISPFAIMRLDTSRAAPSDASSPRITLPLLKLVNEARNEHGMRQHDYERYRRFCTSKTHRLRQTLGVTHKDEKHGAPATISGKAGGKQSGKSKRGKKKQTAATQSQTDKAKGGNVFTEKAIDVAAMTSDR